MNFINPACHCHCHQNKPVPATDPKPVQTKESFSTIFHVASVTRHFNPWSGEKFSEMSTNNNGNNSLQAALQNIPEIRQFMKPWYFPDAQAQNVSYIRTVAIRVTSGYSDNSDAFFQAVFSQLKNQCGVSEKKSDAHPCQIGKKENATEPQETLSHSEKATLASLHEHAVKNDVKECHVNTVATQFAADKVLANNGKTDTPQLTKTYFEERIETLSVWKKSFDGEHAVKHLKAYFS